MAGVAPLRHASVPREAMFEAVAERPFAARNRLVWRDFADAAKLWKLCWILGWLDIKGRYRGSMLGPLWVTLSTAVMVVALGILYGTLFHSNLADFIPFLALSLVLWGYLQTLITEACTCFTAAESMIRSVRMPYFVYAGQLIVRNVLVLAHNVLVIVVVYAIFGIWPGAQALNCLPGLLLWLVDSIAFAVSLGAFCARFRDVPPIIANVVQIAFYITPIIWKPEQLKGSVAWMPFNPFYGLLEVVRAPLLGHLASSAAWASALIYSLVLCIGAWALFVRVRGRIAFWI